MSSISPRPADEGGSKKTPIAPPTAPPTELLRALAVLAEPPGPEHTRVAESVGLADPVGFAGPAGPGAQESPRRSPTASEHGDVFLFQLYPYASVHVGAEGMMGGTARDRVAGFWGALGRTPPAEPDHLSALLALYASLCEEQGRAVLLEHSRAALLHEHIAPWLPHYLARVQELAPGFYLRWAALLSGILEAEADRAGPAERLPLHLREAPPLPDPRVDGGDAFLAGLLATVRTGVMLTRADLASVAGALDLGLRAGERKYALTSLLGQDPGGVLSALAAEARRQSEMHAGRAGRWGVTADFLATRARTAAELLEQLAAEGFADADAAVSFGAKAPVGAPAGADS